MNYNHLEGKSAILMEFQKFAKKGYGTPRSNPRGCRCEDSLFGEQNTME